MSELLQRLSLKSETNENGIYRLVPIESIIMYSTINPEITIHFLKDLQGIKLQISGDDLKNIGLKPSEKFRECFDYVLKEKLINPDINKSEEMQIVKRFFNI